MEFPTPDQLIKFENLTNQYGEYLRVIWGAVKRSGIYDKLENYEYDYSSISKVEGAYIVTFNFSLNSYGEQVTTTYKNIEFNDLLEWVNTSEYQEYLNWYNQNYTDDEK